MAGSRRRPASPSSQRPSTRVDFGVPVQAAFLADPAGNVVELTDVGPLG